MTLSGRRVLVTGGEGFVGAHLVRRLVTAGAEVHVIARGSERAADALLLPPDARVHTADLSSADALGPVVAGIAASHVFHLAGRVDLERSFDVAQACVRDNIGATVSLLHALHGTPAEVLIYTSTTEVYGRNPAPFDEEQAPDPPSAYAVSKLAAEHLCRIHAELNGWRLAVLRLASGYGPGQRSARLVPSAIRASLSGTPMRLRSAGHRRDFVYVGDLVDGIVRAAVRPLRDSTIINLGSETAVSVTDIVQKLGIIAGRPIAVESGAASRPNEAPCWSTSTIRARQLLDWTPATSLDEGLELTFRWYAAHQ